MEETCLFRSDWFLAGLMEFLNSFLVVTKIFLASDQDNWQSLAEVKDFRDPLKSKGISYAMAIIRMDGVL